MAPMVGRRLFVAAAFAREPLRQLAVPATPSLMLGDGSSLPFASFGVQIYDDDTARHLTSQALEAGFRSFFTSPEAGNQRGFALAIRDSGIPRDQIYIAGSVLSDDAVGFRSARATTRQRCDASLDVLASGGVERLDMLLLERAGLDCGSVRGQWKALEDVRAFGSINALGVCNFDLEQIDCMLARANVRPQLHQCQYTLAIRLAHAEVRRAHEQRGIRLMAFSPLGGPPALIPRAILDECDRIGKAQSPPVSRYQVALRWLVQQGVAYSVHSRTAAHLREDLDVFGFRLSDVEMGRLEAMSERAPDYY